MENCSKLLDRNSEFSPVNDNLLKDKSPTLESSLQLISQINGLLPENLSSLENIKREIQNKRNNISFIRKKFSCMDSKLNQAQSKLQNMEQELLNAMLNQINNSKFPKQTESNDTKFSETNRCIPKNDPRNKQLHCADLQIVEKTDKKNKEMREKIMSESVKKWQMIFKRKKENEIPCNDNSKKKTQCRLKEFENENEERIFEKQKNSSSDETRRENRENEKKVPFDSKKTENCSEKDVTSSYKSRKRSRYRKDYSESKRDRKKLKKQAVETASLKPATPKLPKEYLESPASPDGSYDNSMVHEKNNEIGDEENENLIQQKVDEKPEIGLTWAIDETGKYCPAGKPEQVIEKTEQVSMKERDEVSEMELYVAQMELEKLLRDMKQSDGFANHYETVDEIEKDLVTDDGENNVMLESSRGEEKLVLDFPQKEECFMLESSQEKEGKPNLCSSEEKENGLVQKIGFDEKVEGKPKENVEMKNKLDSGNRPRNKKNTLPKENVKKTLTAVFVKRRRRKIVLEDYTTSYSIV